MKVWQRGLTVLAMAAIFVMGSASMSAQTTSASRNQGQPAIESHDGQHDFDFEFGT